MPVRLFVFRLALALGYANPDAMLAEMPVRIFREWIEYANVEPFGEERADLRSAIVAKTIVDMHRSRKSRRPKIEWFMPKFKPREPPKPKTGEQLFEKMKMFTLVTGGKIVDKRIADG